ncbi:hypothetical protein EPUS_05792 [Endocarpon pusillum Z07020]|uniref:FAD-binding domain-containing protein n=1 Tax=Endocarpon pusillum (strain Z07020 / HMAS-L-300199) TaxID=1263415 RepID=U1GXJ2_ENDPU|nr:uncharacterized protein EPUS_05792 [Endocarpon pusillum Z07020]ERF77223.1 hypothetical protein EPUS_05792 [Endocarpon pusillum Z07020]
MAIHWSLDHLEKLLPKRLFAKLSEISCNPNVPIEAGGNYPIINAETGDLLAGVPYARGFRVPRSKMRALCAEGIDVQYGKNLTDLAFSEKGDLVFASFSDGTIAQGSVLLGADGPRSKVREFAMSGAEAAQVSKFPICHHNMTVCYRDVDKAKYLRQRFPTSYLALSQKSHHAFQSISSMPDGQDHPETWLFHLAMAWLGDPEHSLSYEERLAIIKERAQGMGEPARSAFTWIPEDTLVHKADISYWITQPWDNRGGRVTLVGDAAHPMPPYRGQGLNHCICDSSHLLDGLELVRANKATIKDAITAYDEELVPRGRDEVKCSLENGLMLHDWQKVKESPVFRNGFRPMTGHDGKEALSEHAQAQMKRDEEEQRDIPVAAT